MQLLFFILSTLGGHLHGRHGRRMHGRGLHHGGLHNAGHGSLGVGHGVHGSPEIISGPIDSNTTPMSLSSMVGDANMAMNMEQAMAMGMSPMEAASLQEAQTQMRIDHDGAHYAGELAGEVVGGGLTGFNMGGANNPRAAVSNAFHSPLEAALHEAGPFGSRSALSSNMVGADDPTIRQRIQESLDTVHDDTLKANYAKKQRLDTELGRREARAKREMNEMIKANASAAALRDQRAAETKAHILAANAGGNLNAIVPGTNKTFQQEIDEQIAIAEHAGNHARNPDLYELENAAERTGFPRPTIGKEIMDQAARELMQKNMEDAARARDEDFRREEERREASLAAASQLQAEQTKRDAERNEAQRRAKIEGEAVAMAEANASYTQAQANAAKMALQAGESSAANQASASDIRMLQHNAMTTEIAAARAGEAALVRNAEAGAAAGIAAASAANAAIQSDESMVAKMGERAEMARQMASMQNQMAASNAFHANIAEQQAGEAMAASREGSEMASSMHMNGDAITMAGEQAVAQQAMERGQQLASAAAQEKEIAFNARARGTDLANALVQEKAIASEAHSQHELMAIEAKEAAMQAEASEAREKVFASAAAKEAAIAKAVKKEEGAEEAHVAVDSYDVLGTIPDDADTVAIANSSIKFPLKTFKAAQAHNQAEAGALAAQAKIKDDIRGKVTANELDTPLNVIKGEGGYLNVPENAKGVNVESGRVYFQEAAVAAMEKAGQDTSMLEHRINTGERANMGIGLGYYVASANGMNLDIPSPSNPDPPAVISGEGKVLDLSHAEGMDIAKGELKLEKWEDYSRRVRPTVNANVVSNLRENITESIIDDDCVRQALKEADAMYNTKSEIITNPSGESYLKITPPYGVSEQVPYDEAVFNLDKIKQSCRVSQGQTGVSLMQGKDRSGSVGSRKKRSLNIAEGITMEAETEEESLTRSALQEASVGSETHTIIKRQNAFDNQVHGEKSEIVEEGARVIAEETGKSVEEISREGSIKAELKEEAEQMQDTSIGIAKESHESGEQIDIKETEIKAAMNIKEKMMKDSSHISSELHVSETEFTTLMKKVSMQTIATVFYYMKNSSDQNAIKAFEKARSELRVLFGAGESSFEAILFRTVGDVTGFNDPNEQVVIRKETQYVPKFVRSFDKPNKYGGVTTVKQSKMVPVTHIIRIPIKKIIRTPPIRGLTGKEISAGERIKNNNLFVSNGGSPISGVKFVGSHGFNTKSKIKLGDNAMIVGTSDDIKNLVDPASIGNVNDIRITPGEIKRRVKAKGGKVPKMRPDTTNQVKEVVISEGSKEDCKGAECKTVTKSRHSSSTSKSSQSIKG